jgi:hypothetical protein
MLMLEQLPTALNCSQQLPPTAHEQRQHRTAQPPAPQHRTVNENSHLFVSTSCFQ